MYMHIYIYIYNTKFVGGAPLFMEGGALAPIFFSCSSNCWPKTPYTKKIKKNTEILKVSALVYLLYTVTI